MSKLKVFWHWLIGYCEHDDEVLYEANTYYDDGRHTGRVFVISACRKCERLSTFHG